MMKSDVPSIEYDPDALGAIHRHVMAHHDREVGGVLLGPASSDGPIKVSASLEAFAAEERSTSVTFTHDSWERIYRQVDSRFPDLAIVGWYHSHPGFGIFLSSHDTFIHESFFSGERQIAHVVDPVAMEEGFFGWRAGEVCELERRPVKADAAPAETTSDSQGSQKEVERTRREADRRLTEALEEADREAEDVRKRERSEIEREAAERIAKREQEWAKERAQLEQAWGEERSRLEDEIAEARERLARIEHAREMLEAELRAGAQAAETSPPEYAGEPISLAKASFEDLRGIGMSVTQAKRILKRREEGALKTVADLDDVPGFPRELLARLKELLKD